MPKINQLYAYVVADKDENDEGVPAFKLVDGIMPLMGADLDRAKSMSGLAQEVANSRGKPVRLVRSTGLEVIRVFKPKNAKTTSP